jgi:hypothetical protein
MATVVGVVKGNIVVLPEDVQLPDGQPVEVRTIASVGRQPDDQEVAFLQTLLEMGLVEEIRRPSPVSPHDDHTPIEVKGRPLSEMIIEERR